MQGKRRHGLALCRHGPARPGHLLPHNVDMLIPRSSRGTTTWRRPWHGNASLQTSSPGPDPVIFRGYVQLSMARSGPGHDVEEPPAFAISDPDTACPRL